MRNRYAVDNGNRLVVRPARKGKGAFSVDGRFSADSRNRLIYWLNEPSKDYGLKNKVIFTGSWQLNPDHDLVFRLDGNNGQYKNERLVIKGDIIATDRDSLVFEFVAYNKRGAANIGLLKLSGSWQADEYNRLSFAVSKKPVTDIITLTGAWQVNRNQQIVYTYEKADLKRKSRVIHTLAFEGFWQITSGNRLSYVFERSSQSRFDFRAYLESPNLYPKEGVIKHRLGIGIKENKPYAEKVVSLYGAWKFSRKLGLVFEMDYGKGRLRTIVFNTDISLGRKDKVILSLKDKEGEPLGTSITLNHRFLKRLDAEALLRLKRSATEKSVEIGARIPF